MLLLCFFLINSFLAIKVFSKFSWRLSFCLALQLFGLLSWACVELLGLFDVIAFWECFAFWCIPTVGLLFYNFRNKNNLPKIDFSELKSNKILVFFVTTFFFTFLSGMLYAPNTIDSTVYHLTRIEFWLQHRNVDYFATQTDRMLYQPPLSEYMILQFRLLQNSDTFSFIIQWLFSIGSCFAVSLLAEIAGANKKIQYLSLFIAGTTPMVILQSSSTQNDVVVSFFILMTAHFLLKNLKENNTSSAILSGVSIGEAVLTKGTAYVFLFPMCMYWGIMKLIKVYKKQIKFLPQLSSLSLLFIPFLAICGSFYYRNFILIGSPLGVSKELFYVYNNQSHSISSFLSVVFRNFSLHFTVPGIHLMAEKFIFFLHQSILHLDINDPATSFCSYDLPMLGMTEDNAGNFLHFILIFPALFFVFKSKSATLKAIASFGIISFLLFCFQIKWQLWHSRLHIPVFLLMSVPIAFWIEQMKFSKFIVAVLGISALIFSLFCFNRPIIKLPPLTTKIYFTQPRIAQFYTMQEEKGKQMDALIKFLQEKNYKNVAVKSEEMYGNDILYPVMYELREKTSFYPIQMNNKTKVIDKPRRDFDAVLFFTGTPPDILKIEKNYKKMAVNAENLYIFAP